MERSKRPRTGIAVMPKTVLGYEIEAPETPWSQAVSQRWPGGAAPVISTRSLAAAACTTPKKNRKSIPPVTGK